MLAPAPRRRAGRRPARRSPRRSAAAPPPPPAPRSASPASSSQCMVTSVPGTASTTRTHGRCSGSSATSSPRPTTAPPDTSRQRRGTPAASAKTRRVSSIAHDAGRSMRRLTSRSVGDVGILAAAALALVGAQRGDPERRSVRARRDIDIGAVPRIVGQPPDIIGRQRRQPLLAWSGSAYSRADTCRSPARA